jgi:hypothetical protein
MATGGEINPIPESVIEVANRQSLDRYQNKPFGEGEWKMYRRRLERVDTSFKD